MSQFMNVVRAVLECLTDEQLNEVSREIYELRNKRILSKINEYPVPVNCGTLIDTYKKYREDYGYSIQECRVVVDYHYR